MNNKIKCGISSSSTNKIVYTWKKVDNQKSTSVKNDTNYKVDWQAKTNSTNMTQNKTSKLAWTASSNNSVFKYENNQKLKNELQILKMFDHKNIIKIRNITNNDQKNPSILFEECPLNLNQAINNKMFSKVQLVYSIYQIAEGMKYIHSQKIVHLNLNPKNILISKDGIIKISDFKNAQKVTSSNEAKEMDDIYSFGEIVYFILSGRDIKNSEKETILKSFSLLAQQLIEACFYDDLECRPTFEMICNILKENKCNLISLSQQEIEEVSRLIK